MAKRQGRGSVLNDLLSSLVQGSPDFEGAVLVSQDGLVMAAVWPIEGQSEQPPPINPRTAPISTPLVLLP